MISYPEAREMVTKVSLGDLILETDSPYLPPQENPRYSLTRPGMVVNVAGVISKLKNLEVEEVAHTRSANVVKLYGL